jgi:glyoxylase-like metal-dependent hydrolase (beta-lactamase superfamily II)
MLFSGDQLFAGSIGRSDFPYGSHEALMKSMAEKVMVLPDETRVLPGHGPETTIGEERRTNPFRLEWEASAG